MTYVTQLFTNVRRGVFAKTIKIMNKFKHNYVSWPPLGIDNEQSLLACFNIEQFWRKGFSFDTQVGGGGMVFACWENIFLMIKMFGYEGVFLGGVGGGIATDMLDIAFCIIAKYMLHLPKCWWWIYVLHDESLWFWTAYKLY